MLRNFNRFPRVIVEADQFNDFADTRMTHIALFGGALSVHPEVFAKDPTVIDLDKLYFNIGALRAANLPAKNIIDNTNVDNALVHTGTRRMRARLQVPHSFRMLAPAFFDHGYFRVAKATKRINIEPDDRHIVHDAIAGVSYRQLAEERDTKRPKILERIDALRNQAKVSHVTELALYLMMSGELHDRLDADTLPSATDGSQFFDVEELSLMAQPPAPLLSAEISHVEVMRAMNQHEQY